MATAEILASGHVSVPLLRRLIIGVTVLSVAWGLMQIVLYRFAGVNAGLSQTQIAQVEYGFGPGFRTEADTFGKFMVVPFMLFLPEFIEHRRIKHMLLVFLVFTVGVLMNFTRSAIYGMARCGTVHSLLVYTSAQNGSRTRRSAVLLMALSAGVTLMLGGALSSEYATHKMRNFFNKDEIVAGGSSSYRLEMTEAMVNSTLSSTKRIVIGNGWGQTWIEMYGNEVQAGGADVLTVWAYGGAFAAFLYLTFMWLALRASLRAATIKADAEFRALAEGAAFAVGTTFIMAQLAGLIAAPEYWLLMGIVVFIETASREASRALPSGRMVAARPLSRNVASTPSRVSDSEIRDAMSLEGLRVHTGHAQDRASRVVRATDACAPFHSRQGKQGSCERRGPR